MGQIDTFSEEAGNYEILLSHASQLGKTRSFESSCGTPGRVLAWLPRSYNMSEGRATRVTEAKRVPVEKALGRKPIGPPPARVNPAPQTHTPQSPSSTARSES